jgi:hypothetical protein
MPCSTLRAGEAVKTGREVCIEELGGEIGGNEDVEVAPGDWVEESLDGVGQAGFGAEGDREVPVEEQGRLGKGALRSPGGDVKGAVVPNCRD